MTFDNRITELSALGASATANCQSCMGHHGRKASESGIDPDEVAQAVEIGRNVRKGAGSPGASASHAACSGPAVAHDTAGADDHGEPTCSPNRCMPFSSMMTGAWCSAGFRFRGPREAKS
jgi:AhpD family alkylhydroperoxidase